MAVFLPHTVQCVCGNSINVSLADSINGKRSPEVRDKILRGELHRASCGQCGREMTVEKAFYYTDLRFNALFKVCPRGERHTWKDAGREVDEAAKLLPETVSAHRGRALRVIFGIDHLREKLIAQDAGIDDRIVEALKVLLVHEHPVLLRRPRLRLVLDKVGGEELEFAAAFEHDRKRFRIRVPRGAAERLNFNQVADWTWRAHGSSLLDVDDHWVDMWRWSPQPGALDLLKKFAADVKAGAAIDTASKDFKRMLVGLPRGSHLPDWAKEDLKTMFEYVKAGGLSELQDALFEIRFGVELEDDWHTNENDEDIATLWALLKDLPDNNVEGNTKLHEILLDIGQGGGVYDPSSNDISIGSLELANREGFEDVVRHEVGHAVHEMKDTLIDGWLSSRFGWQTFDRSDANIDAWVQLMGGWGTMKAAQRKDVREALRTALGTASSWGPGPTPALPPAHPWHAAGFGPRLAFEKTGANWYRNYATWHRYGSKAFYLNYWYKTFVCVDESALDLVAKMPSNYAAMSHYEFFAELYALYFDLNDPLRGSIPQEVADWLANNIGAVQTGAPMPAQPRARKDYETTTRPRGAARLSTPASPAEPAAYDGLRDRLIAKWQSLCGFDDATMKVAYENDNTLADIGLSEQEARSCVNTYNREVANPSRQVPPSLAASWQGKAMGEIVDQVADRAGVSKP